MPNGGVSKPLFPGNTSANSPRDFSSDPSGLDDMLVVILRALDSPTIEDIECLGPLAQHAVVQALQRVEFGDFAATQSPSTLTEMVPAARCAMLEVLRQMLAFSARRRPTVAMVLAHTLFQEEGLGTARVSLPTIPIKEDFEVSDEHLRDPRHRPDLMPALRDLLAGEIASVSASSAAATPGTAAAAAAA